MSRPDPEPTWASQPWTTPVASDGWRYSASQVAGSLLDHRRRLPLSSSVSLKKRAYFAARCSGVSSSGRSCSRTRLCVLPLTTLETVSRRKPDARAISDTRYPAAWYFRILITVACATAGQNAPPSRTSAIVPSFAQLPSPGLAASAFVVPAVFRSAHQRLQVTVGPLGHEDFMRESTGSDVFQPVAPRYPQRHNVAVRPAGAAARGHG